MFPSPRRHGPVPQSAGMLAVLLLGGSLSAQTELAVFELEGPFGTVGDRVGSAGDVNGDGVDDLLAAGIVGVITYDGVTGEKIDAHAFDGTGVLGIVGTTDLDSDGLRDFVVANGVDAWALSRADGSVIWSRAGSLGGSLGWQIANLGDIDGDLVDDVAIGEPDADPGAKSSAGTIHVLSGADGSVIKLIHGARSQEKVGRSMGLFGDRNGDGRQDLIVGDSGHIVLGNTVGRVRVISALDGAVLFTVVGTEVTFNFALDCAGAGDVDGDGSLDLAVTKAAAGVSTEVLSGSDGSLIWVATSSTFRLIAIGDVTGDGVSELLAGEPGYFLFPGTAQVLDGADGTRLYDFLGEPGAFLSLAALGDITSDGLNEFIFSTTTSQTGGPSATVLQAVDGTLVHHITNPAGGSALGRDGDFVGDWNGDSVDDIALLSIRDIPVFSGATGEVLANFQDETSAFGFGFGATAIAGMGDVNRDMTPDIATGNPSFGSNPFFGDGRVLIFSGDDGGTVDEVNGSAGEQFGWDIESTADRDGDGVRDLYVGAVGRATGGITNSGAVVLLSGATRAVIDTIPGGMQTDGKFGISISADGDITGDGVPDLAIGSWEDSLGFLDSGRVTVFDGDTGATLFMIDGNLDSESLEGEIVGDGNGDGVPDVLVSESKFKLPGEGTNRGRVRLVSGATGLDLWSAIGPNSGGWFGSSFGAADDVNGDGYDDVAAGEGAVNFGTVQILSGLDGSILDSFDPSGGEGSAAGVVLPLGHFDAGGSADVLIGNTRVNGNGGASAWASSQGGVHGFVDVGFAKAGATDTPTLDFYGDLAPLGLVTVTARHAQPAATGVWFIGLSPAYLPFKQGTLVPDPGGFFFVIPLVADATGGFSFTAPNPDSVFEGLELWHQVWWAEPGVPGGVSSSNGVQEIFK